MDASSYYEAAFYPIRPFGSGQYLQPTARQISDKYCVAIFQMTFQLRNRFTEGAPDETSCVQPFPKELLSTLHTKLHIS